MRIHHIILSLLCALCSLSLHAREIDPLFGDTIDRTAEDFVIASVCVVDPTDIRDDLLGIWGHAWIRLQCPIFNLDVCFSYESESANDNFARFLKGDLKMGLFACQTFEYIKDYQTWNRAVHEYHLNLPPDAEQRLWEIMDNHVTNDITLEHDLARYGCANTVVHYVEMALRPQYHIRYPKNVPFDKDRCSPRQLAEVWCQSTINNEPLLTYIGDLTEAPTPSWFAIWGLPIAIALFVLIVVGGIVFFIIHLIRKG